MKHTKLIGVATFFLLATNSAMAQSDHSRASTAKTTFTPKVHHPNIKRVSLFAQNPDVVTPVGIAVAPDGRVFVQENHTHKRNSDYQGPEADRILVFEDTDNDGVADKRSVFYEGHTFSTDLLFGPDGHLYVSTRWFIGRFPNAATKNKADGEPEKLVSCETDGNYPHNGVGGLAIDPANPDWLAFGFGENLGADYTFVGSDGAKLSGGAEGGSTYRCRTDGSKLTRQSTGHWNAFGMAYDLDGNLFSTDNDPNATPPNRLLHIVSGADYGYEYRYGRSGRHPLICWNGENPGTLGMTGALGEAACGLVPHGRGKLLSASWTDNRVDLHSLIAKGESFTATREPFLSGPDDFRPVHFSYSADGRHLYFTDWVKLSYPVHGHGRIWRVEFKQPVSLKPSTNRPAANELSTKDALVKLGSDDPYARTAAINVLAEQPNVLTNYKWQRAGSVARANFAVALKRSDAAGRTEIIPALLSDEDSDVRYVGIKWIADEKLVDFAPNLKAVLDRSDLSRRDLLATVAALEVVGKTTIPDGKGTGNSSKKGKIRNKEFSPSDTLLELALDTARPPGLRAMALANVKVDHPKLTVATLAPLAKSNHKSIQREAVHTLVIHEDSGKAVVLAKIAADVSLDENLRADAIAGLASVGSDHEELLNELSSDSNRVISEEANRTRVAAGLAKRHVEMKPKPDQLDEWIELLKSEATLRPDVAVGRRLFFHSKFAGCYKCHAIHGRGNSVGPDLTGIHKQTDVTPDWLLKHIVNPNAEMAPYYRPQQLVTVDGKVLTGLIVGKEGQKQGYVATDGTVFYVDKGDVEERREMTTSIMPTGLMDALSANEIRHLLAFLLSGEPQKSKTVASKPRSIPANAQPKLTKINGRHWLVNSDGKPFFAHGITHVGNRRGKFDFPTISQRCRELGFNAYGYGCPDDLRHDMPYLESWNHLVPISTYRGKNVKFIDIFDPKEHARLETGVRNYCLRSRRNPRNVIGYCWTDLAAWPLKNSTKTNWVEYIRSLPKDAPGQKAYQKFLTTWEGDDDTVRDQAFLKLIAREYFRVVGTAQRKYDPEHLVFGDRFAFNTLDDDVVKEMLPYIDAIAFQPHFWGPFPQAQFDKLYQQTGKPIIICDWAIRFKDGDKDVRMWKMADDSVAAGRAYTEYMQAALKTNYILGVFWCNPVDTPKGFGKAGVKQGFFGDGLAERPGLHQAVREFNAYRDELTPKALP